MILEESETGRQNAAKNRKKVLIIDDKKENLEVVSFFLEAHEIDYKILDNGRIALDTIRNEGSTYQLILLYWQCQDLVGSTFSIHLRRTV